MKTIVMATCGEQAGLMVPPGPHHFTAGENQAIGRAHAGMKATILQRDRVGDLWQYTVRFDCGCHLLMPETALEGASA